MKIVAISDTHGDHRALTLPAGDLLVHAGDLSAAGEQEQIEDFIQWFGTRDFAHKVFVAGNHDSWVEEHGETMQALCNENQVTYLNTSGVVIEGVKIWGSPFTPRFMNWSFMLDRGPQIAEHWSKIPQDTDLLITHGPPFGILDEVELQATATAPGDSVSRRFERAGCPELSKRVQAVAPAVHVFGHIHECYGELTKSATRYINASSMNNVYVLQNAPVVFNLASADSANPDELPTGSAAIERTTGAESKAAEMEE